MNDVVDAVEVNSQATHSEGVAAPKMIQIPLSRLRYGSHNVRNVTQGAEHDAGIIELAALIKAQGLLMALCVTDNGDGTYGVEAGGRRFRALAYLAMNGDFDPEGLVECKLFDSSRAVEISLAENSGRESLHPADEFKAFARLRAEGKTDTQIASRFGVSLLTVQRRMKLAEVSPRFVDMFRAGAIDMDQIAALAIESDTGKQEAVWDALPQWQRSPYHLREALTDAEVDSSDKLACFVGLEAYTAAGGTIREDLFSANGTFWYQDRELLMRLANERMEEAQAIERAAGWSWVEVVDSLYSSGYYDCTHLNAKAVMSDEEAEGLAELEQHIEAAMERHREVLSALREALDEGEGFYADDDEPDDDEPESIKALRVEANELEEVIDGLKDLASACRESALQWTPQQLASAGVMLCLESQGRLVVKRGLRRPVDKKAMVKELKAAGKPIPAALQGVVKERAEYSERLMADMTAHQTAALKAALIDSPHVALALVVHRMFCNVDHSYVDSPLKLSLSTTSGQFLGNTASEFAESPAALAIEQAEQRWGDVLPGGDGQASTLDWFVGQDDARLLELLAYFAALGIDNIHRRERKDYQTSDALADALELDMADWWKPTPANYLSGVSKAQLMEAVTEQCGEEAAKLMAAQKKGDAVAYAASKLADTRWLPVPLRRKQRAPK